MAISVPLYLMCGLAPVPPAEPEDPGINLFRTILFLPSVLSGVAVAVLWVALLNPDVGAVNTLLRAIGLDDPPRWLQSPTWAVPSVALVGLWGIGAARSSTWRGCRTSRRNSTRRRSLDGAGPLQRFRYVTLPMITPTLLFVLLTGLIDAFQVFDLAYVLSRGGDRGVGNRSSFYLINLWNGVRERQVRVRLGARVGAHPDRRGDDPARLPDLGPVGVLRVRPGSGAVSRVKTTIEAPTRRVGEQATSRASVGGTGCGGGAFTLAVYLLLLALCAFILLPVSWMLTAALKPDLSRRCSRRRRSGSPPSSSSGTTSVGC